MTLRRDDDAPDLPDLPRETADRVLRRAIELESTMGEVVTGEQLKDIARQVDLDPHYLRMALAEIGAAEVERTAEAGGDGRAGLSDGRPASAMTVLMMVLIVCGLLAMVAGVGLGTRYREGTPIFIVGASIFGLGFVLMLVLALLRQFADNPAPETNPPRPPVPRIASPQD